MTTFEQAHEYFIQRAQCLNVAPDKIEELWHYAINIIKQAYVYIDNDYSTNAFLETTCNGILCAYEDGVLKW